MQATANTNPSTVPAARTLSAGKPGTTVISSASTEAQLDSLRRAAAAYEPTSPRARFLTVHLADNGIEVDEFLHEDAAERYLRALFGRTALVWSLELSRDTYGQYRTVG